MTNSERFFKAHKTAKETRGFFCSYRDAFSFALREVYAMEKREKTTEEKLRELGLTARECNGMRRYYINDDALEAVFGLSIDHYKTGNIRGATLNGEGISNSRTCKLLGRGIWYDAEAGRWMQKTEFGPRELNDILKNSIRL